MGAAVASRGKTSASQRVLGAWNVPSGQQVLRREKRFGKSDSLASAAAEPPAASRVIPAWKSSPWVFNPRLWTAAPRLPAAQGVKFRPGGIRGTAPLCLRSVFPPRPRANVQHAEPAPGGAASARYKACSGSDSFASWHGWVPVWITAAGIPGNCSWLREQRLSSETGADSSPERWSGSSGSRSRAGAGAAGQPRSRPGSRAGACQQLGNSFSMRQQLGEAPGPRRSERAPLSPSAAVRDLDLPRGTDNPRGWGRAEIPPQPPPAKCCHSSVVIPARCCDTDAGREIRAPASSHSRGCCSSLALREPLQRFGPCPAPAVSRSAG